MIGPLEVLKDVTARFDQLKIDYFLVGSLAAMFYSRPRFTNDIDLVVQIKSGQLKDFEINFPLDDYNAPPAEVLHDEILRMGTFNLIHQASGIKIDIVLLKNTEFYEAEFSRRKKVKFTADFEAYIASPEDIIIKKLDFYREGGSEKHIADIREIISCNDIDQAYLNKWLHHFGLQAVWEQAQLK
ncbi:MAG: DUF6036 family nucleotidyltransferase [Bdellovibrionales bacterium]